MKSKFEIERISWHARENEVREYLTRPYAQREGQCVCVREWLSEERERERGEKVVWFGVFEFWRVGFGFRNWRSVKYVGPWRLLLFNSCFKNKTWLLPYLTLFYYNYMFQISKFIAIIILNILQFVWVSMVFMLCLFVMTDLDFDIVL